MFAFSHIQISFINASNLHCKRIVRHHLTWTFNHVWANIVLKQIICFRVHSSCCYTAIIIGNNCSCWTAGLNIWTQKVLVHWRSIWIIIWTICIFWACFSRLTACSTLIVSTGTKIEALIYAISFTQAGPSSRISQ